MSTFLEGLKTRVRGVLGLGLFGGVAGAAVGAVLGVVRSVVLSGFFADAEYLRYVLAMAFGNAVGFGMMGAFTTAGFGVLLAATERHHTLQELSLWRMGAFGALVAASFPPLFVVATAGPAVYLAAARALLPVSGVLAVAGGAATAGLVAVAQRAGRRELEGATGPEGRLGRGA